MSQRAIQNEIEHTETEYRARLEGLFREREEEGFFTVAHVPWAINPHAPEYAVYGPGGPGSRGGANHHLQCNLAHRALFYQELERLTKQWEAERRHPPSCLLHDSERKDWRAPSWQPLVDRLPDDCGLEDAAALIADWLSAGADPSEVAQTLTHCAYRAAFPEQYAPPLSSVEVQVARSAYVVQPLREGDFPPFCPPARWRYGLPKDATLWKVLKSELTRPQLKRALEQRRDEMEWFRHAHAVTAIRLPGDCFVLARWAGPYTGVNEPVAVSAALSADDQALAQLVWRQDDSVIKDAPSGYHYRFIPRYMEDPESAEYREWVRSQQRRSVDIARCERSQRWEQADIKQAEIRRLDEEVAATGRVPEPPESRPGYVGMAERCRQEAYREWLQSYQAEVRAGLASALDAAPPRPAAAGAPPDHAALRKEFRRLLDSDLTMTERWAEIRRLLPGFAPAAKYYGTSGEPVSDPDLTARMGRLDWSEAETILEEPWSGRLDSVAKGRRGDCWTVTAHYYNYDRNGQAGLRQRLALSGGYSVERRIADPLPMLTWLNQSLPAAPKTDLRLPRAKTRRIKAGEWAGKPPAAINERLWQVRDAAADRFDANYAAAGGRVLPPSPLVDADSPDERFAEKEGWWDFAHRHPELVAGMYGGLERVPKRGLDHSRPAVPQAWSGMPSGALNGPMSEYDLADLRRRSRMVAEAWGLRQAEDSQPAAVRAAA